MFHANDCTPKTKVNSQNFPFHLDKPMDLFSTNEKFQHNYTRYSEMSASSQDSCFTPSAISAKKIPVLDDITNLLNNVNPKRLDFSGGLDTSSSKGQTPNYVIKKFDIEKSINMEIEETNQMEEDGDPEKPEEGKYGSTMMDGIIQNTDNWARKKTKTSGNVMNNQEYIRPKQKKPSLIKRWKGNDKIFEGKYSTGATPKMTKNETGPKGRMPIVPLRRSNTDVPATLESDKVLTNGKKEVGANKYINNLLGVTYTQKESPISPQFNNSLTDQISQPHMRTARPRLLTDFPLDTAQNNNIAFPKLSHTMEPRSHNINKPQVPQYEPIQEENHDVVSKLLNFEEEDEDEELGINRGGLSGNLENYNLKKMIQEDQDVASPITKQSSPRNEVFSSPKKDFNTPAKKNSHFAEVELNFFNTATAKKDPHSKLFSDIESERKHLFNHFGGRSGYDDDMSESYENPHQSRSRFEQDYTVLEVLGSGFFGTVYKSQNKLDGLIYAVKCTKNKLKGMSNINQALNEAQALASLSVLDENPFIVRYYSAWIEDDRLYLVMEHCQSNLKALRQQHTRFSESMIRHIMRDICMGLRHLHNQKIVHLDIKPENILYSKTKKYKIADLGLSRIAQRSNHEDINEGDCRYLAPELLKDYPDHELPDLTKADIFSFGASIYELMIGTDLPKNGKEWTGLRDGNFAKLDQLNYSNSLKSMLRSMMSNNPDNRPSARELLSHFLQSEIELELKWEKRQNKLLKERVKELEEKLRRKRKNSV